MSPSASIRIVLIQATCFTTVLTLTLSMSNAADEKDPQKVRVKGNFDKVVAEGLKGKQVTDDGKKALDSVVKKGLDHLAKDKFDERKVKAAETNLKKLVTDVGEAAADGKITADVVKKVVTASKAPCDYPPFCLDAKKD